MTTCNLWATVLAALLLVPSVVASADPAADAYKKGVLYLDKQDFNSAVAAFTEAIRLSPKSAEACCGRGCACGRQGKVGANLTETIRFNPKLARAYYGRGTAYSFKGEFDRAIAEFTEAIRLDPTFAKAFCNRGYAYSKKGEFGRGIADFGEAIRLDPNLATAYRNRGLAYNKKGEFDRAIVDCTEAIRLDPTDASGVLWPGRCLRSQAGLRQSHRRLQRGHPAEPEAHQGVLQPGLRLCR